MRDQDIALYRPHVSSLADRRTWKGTIFCEAVTGLMVTAVGFSAGLFAAIVAFVTITAGLSLYERRYSRAAEATRARLD